jgi:predicted ATPase
VSRRFFASQTLDRTPAKLLNNGVVSHYKQLVSDGKLRHDDNQFKLVSVLEHWGNQFITKEPRLLEFKDEMNKLIDLGQHAQSVNANKRISEQYNTFMDDSYGKRQADPYL